MNKLHEVVTKPMPKLARKSAAAAAQAPSASDAAGGAGDESQIGNAEIQAASDLLWEERADRAYGMLVLSFSSPALTSLVQQVTPGDAHGVWKLLLGRYERKTVASQAHVIEQLMSTRMEAGEHVDSYVARLKNTVSVLAEMGEPVSPSMQKHVLMQGLPSSYSSLVQSLGLQQAALTFEDIVTHLVDHQEKLLLRERASGSGSGDRQRHADVASYAQVGGGGGSGSAQPWQSQQRGQRGPGAQGNRFGNRNGAASARNNHSGVGDRPDSRTCFTCDQTGHIAYDCPRNRDAKKCSTCRRLGHSPNQCPSKNGRNGGGGRGAGQQRQQATSTAMTAVSPYIRDEEQDMDSEEDMDAVFMVREMETEAEAQASPFTSQLKRSTTVEWVLDSGATRHLVRHS